MFGDSYFPIRRFWCRLERGSFSIRSGTIPSRNLARTVLEPSRNPIPPSATGSFSCPEPGSEPPCLGTFPEPCPRTLPRNLPGTGGSEPAPEPSRNLPEPAPGKPPRNRPGAYIGKDPIAKAVGELYKYIYIPCNCRKLYIVINILFSLSPLEDTGISLYHGHNC